MTSDFQKLSSPIPFAEIGTKLGDDQLESPEGISGSVELNAIDELSKHFSQALPRHLHIIVEVPPTRCKYSRFLYFHLILILSLPSPYPAITLVHVLSSVRSSHHIGHFSDHRRLL